MTNKIPAGIKPKAPLWSPTHRFTGSDKLVFFNVGEEVVRESDSEFEGAGLYRNEAGRQQNIPDNCVEEL